MIQTQVLQLLAFIGCPSSFGLVAPRVLQSGKPTEFLCVLGPGEDSSKVKQQWEFSVQPLDPDLALYIIHEPPGRAFEGIAEFASTLAKVRGTELDLLFLSEEASWRGSRKLARDLDGLKKRLEKLSKNCLVRRI